MKNKTTILHFNEGQFKFSSGHFTVFSKTEREPLHGHNYSLAIQLTAHINEPGITFDYRLFHDIINRLCQQLNWRTLIATQSPYTTIIFNEKSMWLLKTDVVLLPLDNITLETLSEWFFMQIALEKTFITQCGIKNIVVKVFNGPLHGVEHRGEMI